MPAYNIGSPIGDQEGGTVITITVTVNSDATAPVQYQWYKNSIVLSGEVGPVLTYTLQAEDSYASFNVLVQNPCGSELSASSTVGEITDQPICKVYECDAFNRAILAVSPDVYFQMDGGPNQNDGNLAAGGLIYDVRGGPSAVINSACAGDRLQTVASLLSSEDTCVNNNNAYQFIDCFSTQYAQTPATTPASTPEEKSVNVQQGTIICLWDKTGEAFNLSMYASLIDKRGFDIDVISGVGGDYYSNITVEQYDGSGDHIIGTTVNMQIAAPEDSHTVYPGGGILVILRWSYDGTNTTIEAIGDDGVVLDSATGLGSYGTDSGWIEKFLILGKNVRTSNTALWGRPLTDAEIASIQEGISRNLSTYVDPNPNCRPPV